MSGQFTYGLPSVLSSFAVINPVDGLVPDVAALQLVDHVIVGLRTHDHEGGFAVLSDGLDRAVFHSGQMIAHMLA